MVFTAGLGGAVRCASDWRPGGRGFDPRRGRQHSFVEIDHEIFSMVILSLPLFQEGQLSVSGERMCTILVNRIEDYACPVNVWLGKLTALDMTPLGWLGRKTSTQTNNGIHWKREIFFLFYCLHANARFWRHKLHCQTKHERHCVDVQSLTYEALERKK